MGNGAEKDTQKLRNNKTLIFRETELGAPESAPSPHLKKKATAPFRGINSVDSFPSNCLQGVLNLFHHLLFSHTTAAFLQFFNRASKAEHDPLVMEHKDREEALICTPCAQDSSKSQH